MFKWFISIAWALSLLAVFLFTRVNCCHCPDGVKEVAKVVPVVQTKPKIIVEVIKPKIKKHVKPVLRVLNNDITFAPPEITCDELLERYYSVNYYQETSKDSAMSITVTDSVSENQIQYRKVEYLRLLPDKIITEVRHDKFRLDVVGSFNTVSGLGVGGVVGVNRWNFGYNYYPFGMSHQISFGYTLIRR